MLRTRTPARPVVVVAVLGILLTVAPWSARPSDAQVAIPQLALWQSHMVTVGQQYCSSAIANKNAALDPALGATYYDAARVFYQIADYTGNSSWNTCAQAAAYVYRDRYVMPNSGKVPG